MDYGAICRFCREECKVGIWKDVSKNEHMQVLLVLAADGEVHAHSGRRSIPSSNPRTSSAWPNFSFPTVTLFCKPYTLNPISPKPYKP